MIRFEGVLPQPVEPAGHNRHRALVTIAFFHLDDTDRGLIRERAEVIPTLYLALKTLAGKPSRADLRRATRTIEAFTAPGARHANCARCFRALFERDPDGAARLGDAALEFFAGKS